MWNLKNNNKPMNKTDPETQKHETDCGISEGSQGWVGRD